MPEEHEMVTKIARTPWKPNGAASEGQLIDVSISHKNTLYMAKKVISSVFYFFTNQRKVQP